MDYTESLSYLYSFVDWERGIGYGVDAPPRFTLARVSALLQALGNPHHDFASVHVAGSKGKGSTAAIIESILRAAGLRTGLYTQPHLHTFRERVRINNEPISQGKFSDLVTRVGGVAANLQRTQPELGSPTTYELATAIGFLCFAEAAVDMAVVEVGLGGRLDATNVLKPCVSAITSISLEHTAILGNTLEAIAREKAGIVKDGGVLVHAPNPAGAVEVFKEVCVNRRARIVAVDERNCEAAATLGSSDCSAGASSNIRAEPVAGLSVPGSTSSPRTDAIGDARTHVTGDVQRDLPADVRSDAIEDACTDAAADTRTGPLAEERSDLSVAERTRTAAAAHRDSSADTGRAGDPAAGEAASGPMPPVQECTAHVLGEERVVRFPLLGRHQRLNLSVALGVIDELAAQGVSLSRDAVCAGIAAARWPARFELLSAVPIVIADGAHTPDAIVCLRKTLAEHYPGRSVHAILGTNQDKEFSLLLDALLPAIDRLIVTRSRHPRAQDPRRIASAAGKVPTVIARSVAQAVSVGIENMCSDDVLCVTGSLFVAAEAREAFGLAEHIDPPLAARSGSVAKT